ncbi:hypothetical protein CsSME_00003323 [Camellia sinensis var. sinensis]
MEQPHCTWQPDKDGRSFKAFSSKGKCCCVNFSSHRTAAELLWLLLYFGAAGAAVIAALLELLCCGCGCATVELLELELLLCWSCLLLQILLLWLKLYSSVAGYHFASIFTLVCFRLYFVGLLYSAMDCYVPRLSPKISESRISG